MVLQTWDTSCRRASTRSHIHMFPQTSQHKPTTKMSLKFCCHGMNEWFQNLEAKSALALLAARETSISIQEE